AFVPEPYWLVEAKFAASGERNYAGRYLGGKRVKEDEAAKIVEETQAAGSGTITKLEKKEEREIPALLYDLTSLQRHANTLFGFSARRTLGAAQKLYEDKKAITYPRTNSKYLSTDLVEEILPTAANVGQNREYAAAAQYVTRLAELPLDRVVNDAKVGDHHAIIPTNAEHNLEKFGEDELKIYDLIAKRFLAIFHPEAVFERTRVETTVAEHVFRTSGRVLIQVGYIERDGRALHATEKGIQVIRLLGAHALTSAELTGGWEHRLDLIEKGKDSRNAFMHDIVKFTTETVNELDQLKDIKIERANLGPCPVCGKDVIENRKGYSCWTKDDPGCGFVVWKSKAGKTLTPVIVRELMEKGRTEKPVTGFRGRSGRSFSAKLKLAQTDEGKW